MKCSIYLGVSLDGFIARPDGSLDWLPQPSDEAPKEDYGYGAFMESVDLLVMGRLSFEKVLTFGEWPYGEMKVKVLSSRGVAIPQGLAHVVSAAGGEPEELIKEFSREGFRHAYVDGGRTGGRFLQGGLIDQIILTRIPVIIGCGLGAFGEITQDIDLQHLETKSFPSGFVQSRYRPLKRGQG